MWLKKLMKLNIDCTIKYRSKIFFSDLYVFLLLSFRYNWPPIDRITLFFSLFFLFQKSSVLPLTRKAKSFMEHEMWKSWVYHTFVETRNARMMCYLHSYTLSLCTQTYSFFEDKNKIQFLIKKNKFIERWKKFP